MSVKCKMALENCVKQNTLWYDDEWQQWWNGKLLNVIAHVRTHHTVDINYLAQYL